ncbi:TPA: hypothetical protein ACITJS_004397, partial [Salmonella enterica subsp. diarizonae serovar 61:q,v:z35]
MPLAQIQYSISEINSGTLIQADSREPVTLKARLCGILTAGLSGITTHVHGFYTFHFNKSKNQVITLPHTNPTKTLNTKITL